MKSFYQINSKSFEDNGVQTMKDLWSKIKESHRGLSISVDTEFIQKAENENSFEVTMSTDSTDRHGDIVKQNWDLKPFKKNPVLLDSHNYGSIEHIIGRVNGTKVKDGKLVGKAEFALANPKGLLAFKMAQDGFLNATSVGFIPLEFDDKGNIAKSELLELSAVSVPANAEALFAKAFDAATKSEEEPEEEPEEEETCETCKCATCECDTTEEDGSQEEEEPTPAPEQDEPVTEPEEPRESKVLRATRALAKEQDERQARKKKLLKDVANLVRDMVASQGRSSNRRKVNKAVKKLLEAKD